MCCADCTGAVVISIGFGCCTGSSISIAFVGAGFNNGDVGICIRVITGVPGGGIGTVGAGGDGALALPSWIGLDMSIPPIPIRGGEDGGVAPIPIEASPPSDNPGGDLVLPSEIPGDAFGDAIAETSPPSSATGESRAGLGHLVCDNRPLATATGSKCASSV